MSPDELKSMPKGQFIVMKTGMHPVKVTLRLFLDWGICFDKPYEVPERAQREVAYASRQELEQAIINAGSDFQTKENDPKEPPAVGMDKRLQTMAKPKEEAP